MRTRVPVAMRNRLRKLERREQHDLPVGGWPAIMSLDDWETLASHLQGSLAAASHGEIASPTEPVTPPKVRKADDGYGEVHPLSAVEGYLQAQQKAREARASLRA